MTVEEWNHGALFGQADVVAERGRMVLVRFARTEEEVGRP
jgi:hypothetical protein